MKIYDCHWEEIPMSDWPESGEICICKSPQYRHLWSVSIMGDGTLESDTVARGLFWQKKDAMKFAEILGGE